MRITGWELPEGQTSRPRLRASALDRSVVVVFGPRGSGKTSLARLLATSLYGEPEQAPGEVEINDAKGSRAVRPSDPPVVDGLMPYASLRDASAAWRPFNGRRSSNPHIDAAIVRGQRIVEHLDAQLTRLEANKPVPIAGEPPHLHGPPHESSDLEPGDSGSSRVCERDRSDLMEMVDQAAMTRLEIARSTADLRTYASVPPAAELDDAATSLDTLRKLVKRSNRLAEELEAQANTASILERELERMGAPLHAPAADEDGSLDPVALVQPLLLVAALGLIAATVVALLSDDPDRGPLLGIVALIVAVGALVAPTRPLRPRSAPDPAEPIRARRQIALDASASVTVAFDEAHTSSAQLAATLGLEGRTEVDLDNRAEDIAAYRDAREQADRLTNTIDAATGLLRDTVDRTRTLSLQLADPDGNIISTSVASAHISDWERRAQADADECTRHDNLIEQIRLARTLTEEASESLQHRHPVLLTRVGEYLGAASNGRWTGVAVTSNGPELLSSNGNSASGETTVGETAVGETAVSKTGVGEGARALADLVLALAVLEDGTAARQLPVLIDDVTLPEDPILAGTALGCVSRLAERSQLVLFTADEPTRDLLLGAFPTASAVELPGIRVLVTPPE